MKKPLLIYFSYGSTKLHYRTIFSILSLWSVQNKEVIQILIWTDDPKLFEKYLGRGLVQFRTLSSQDVTEMMGPENLIHRVKIGIMQKTSTEYPEQKIISVDSDTFFIKNPTLLFERISKQYSLMHVLEYPMKDLSRFPLNDKDGFGKVYHAIKDGQIKCRGINITLEFDSWNAGVIGLSPAHFDIFDDVYELTDQLYAKSHNHACEQYAFSWSINSRTEILEAIECIYHYWHSIKKEIVDEYLSNYFCHFSIENHISELLSLTNNIKKQIDNNPKMIRYKSMIAFSESHYVLGYLLTIKLLFLKPEQPALFFKDVGYYTLKLLGIKK